jgi:hypothetical protein
MVNPDIDIDSPKIMRYNRPDFDISFSTVEYDMIILRHGESAHGLGDTKFLSTAGFPEGEIQNALMHIPSGKTITSEQVGHLVAYLTSEQAINFVGQTLLMDGGMG